MATSAFKSTSKRGTTTTTTTIADSNSRILRRSRSVSAISRTKDAPQLDIPSEFSNKCNNPLFSNTDNAESTVGKALGTTRTAAISDDGRGRSVTRDSSSKPGIGRSVSRIRRRSVSRGHHSSYESEKEERVISTYSNKQSESKQFPKNGKIASLTRNASDISGRAKSLQTSTSQAQVSEYSEDDSVSSLQIVNWDEMISNGSFSEAEDKTTVHEQTKLFHGDHSSNDTTTNGIYETVQAEVRRAISDIQNDLESVIRRNNNVTITNHNIGNIPPDLVNPGAVELVFDIRREYSKKLKESEERARKLREDLAVEEHRGKELNRILKDIIPEPKACTSQKSRLRKRPSSERKNMSKRLSEEAMAFFDECVSISTFDSSDFSATEDPAQSSVDHNMVEPSLDEVSQTSQSHVTRNDIMSYVKHFERDEDIEKRRSSYYDAEEYKLQGCLESFLFDKVLFKNRIESGSLHLCGGSFSPFGPAF